MTVIPDERAEAVDVFAGWLDEHWLVYTPGVAVARCTCGGWSVLLGATKLERGEKFTPFSRHVADELITNINEWLDDEPENLYWAYSVEDEEGLRVGGTMLAPDRDSVKATLAKRGYEIVLRIEEIKMDRADDD